MGTATYDVKGNLTMRAKTKCAAVLLAITSTVFAPMAATAAAASGQSQDQQSCVNLGGTQSMCQSPGNTQINDAPPPVDYFPYAGGAT